MVKTIFCEDAYGKGFFRNLIKKIKKAEPNQLGISIKSMKGPFDSKAARAVAAARMRGKVIVVVDAHGKTPHEVENSVKQACGPIDGLHVVVVENAIEDWIAANECVDPRKENALSYLRHNHRYEKYKLPSYGERIDAEKLAQKQDSFKNFLEALNDP
ncbi:MAG: hypothetical protein QXS12_01255 [Candidatus Caldarchaeum sp.]